MMLNEFESKNKVYPDKADSEGYYYTDFTSESFGIKTKVENGTIYKKVEISNDRVVILKQLSGQNLISLKNKLYKKNNANTKFQLELLAMCAKVNERYFNSDYYANYLLCSELNKLLIASAEINLL